MRAPAAVESGVPVLSVRELRPHFPDRRRPERIAARRRACDLPRRMRKNTHFIPPAAVETRIHDNQSHRRSRDSLAKSRSRRTLARDAGEVVEIGSTCVRLVAPQLRHKGRGAAITGRERLGRIQTGHKRSGNCAPTSLAPRGSERMPAPGLWRAGVVDAETLPGSLSLAPNRRAAVPRASVEQRSGASGRVVAGTAG